MRRDRQRWQPEEDSLLLDYVRQYGPKEWTLLPHRMGGTGHLFRRDPKSCHERWKNYLRPGLKKGSLSPEEQALVVSLQAKHGNKWKLIASHLPGRTPKRLGKWWEVYKEKQLKQRQKTPAKEPGGGAAAAVPSLLLQPQQTQYDHILETFAEKYVIPPPPPPPPPPRSAPSMVPDLSLSAGGDHPHPPQTPVLSLGTASASHPAPPPLHPHHHLPFATHGLLLPPWMSSAAASPSSRTPPPPNSSTPSTVTAGTSSSSPSEPRSPDLAVAGRYTMGAPPQQQQAVAAAALVGLCRELEEGRQGWLQHKKEARWRLSRLEQQLEMEKARKVREKAEEMEARVRALRDQEAAELERIEAECREQLAAFQRDADAKEDRMVEAWAAKHAKLARLLEQLAAASSSSSSGGGGGGTAGGPVTHRHLHHFDLH